MLYKDINQKFTEIVAGFIKKGFVVNTATMTGSQSEKAKADFTDGKNIYRVVLAETDYTGLESGFYGAHILKLTVGKDNSGITPNSSNPNGTEIIWNYKLETIYEESYFEIATKDNGEKVYGTKEEYKQIKEKRLERKHAKRIAHGVDCTTEKTIDIVIPYIKAVRGLKRVNRKKVAVTRTRFAEDGAHFFSIDYGKDVYYLH